VSAQYLPLALLSALTLGAVQPSWGLAASRMHIPALATFGIFLVQGLQLRRKEAMAALTAKRECACTCCAVTHPSCNHAVDTLAVHCLKVVFTLVCCLAAADSVLLQVRLCMALCQSCSSLRCWGCWWLSCHSTLGHLRSDWEWCAVCRRPWLVALLSCR
jgi:hypothetical protein